MIGSIYTSVSNANIAPCGKHGKPIKSDPIPLLKENYLGEYRTALEKAKVRKNLGIADNETLEWGNIQGVIENQKDLTNYIESKWIYSSDLSESIVDVKSALDYALYFVTNFKVNDEAVQDALTLLQVINNLIENTLQVDIQQNANDIVLINNDITQINSEISRLNNLLININVDENILAWIKDKLNNSNTIELENDETLKVVLSEESDNAIQEKSDGLYSKDFTEDISGLQTSVETLGENFDNLESSVDQLMADMQSNIDELNIYNTDLDDDISSPSAVGGIASGTTVSQLKGKTFSLIIDSVLFPTVVRNLVYPTLYFSILGNQLVEVNSEVLEPELTFTLNDAGELISKTQHVIFAGSEFSGNRYSSLGNYTYQGEASYQAGDYLVDNKGNITDKRVPSGNLTTEFTVTTTYPWYAGNTNSVTKLNLIRFNQDSGVLQISLQGRAVIKLPGSNSQISSFKVDGGLGYLDVDLTGWTTSTEILNGITYQVWTKNDSYAAMLPHRINFTLRQ